MSTTTDPRPLTFEEAHAALFSIADDLIELAGNLKNKAEDAMQGDLDRVAMTCGDMRGAARMISDLVAPIDLLLAQLHTEEATDDAA